MSQGLAGAAESSGSHPEGGRLPREVSRYVLFDHIGRGGMADIFLARMRNSLGGSRLCVIKEILPHLSNDERFAEMLSREAKLAAQLSHANVVQVFDLGELADGSPYLVMELLEGQALSTRLGIEGALPIGDVCSIVAEVLGALEAAHAGGIVHRDLKPDNVFLTATGGVKLLDFGISKTSDETMSLTRTGAVVGTPYYLAPEQARECLQMWDDLGHITLIGHSHLCKVFELRPGSVEELPAERFQLDPDAKYIVSVGSVGQPRDYDNRASFTTFDTESRTFDFKRVEYDIESAASKIFQSKLERNFGHRLFIGV